MTIIHEIQVDFQRIGIRPKIYVKENDMASRFVHVRFYNDGSPYAIDVPEEGSTIDVTALMCYAKPDGTSGVYDTIGEGEAEHTSYAYDQDNKGVTVEIAPSMCIGFGLVRCEIRFVKGGKILGTFTFDVEVERSVTTGTKADDYFSYRALDELYAEIDEAKENAAEALAAGLHDITAEYITAKASRPTLTVDTFLLEQTDGLYRIDAGDGEEPCIARVVTDRAENVHMDVVSYSQGTREQKFYINGTLVTTVRMSDNDSHTTIDPSSLMHSVDKATTDINGINGNISSLRVADTLIRNRMDTMDSELENLIVAGDGKIYTKSVDSTEAYTKIVPANALPFAALDSIGGHSEVIDGEIVSADVQSINASGKTPNPIPQAIRALPGYGWSAGDVYNEVDHAKKQYIQRVQRVLMPELPWVPSSTGIVHTVPFSAFSQPPKSVSNTIKANLLTSVFVTSKAEAASGSDGKVAVVNSATVRIGTADLSAISGKYLYYELATPIITDISNLLPANFEVLPVEDSGTVTFQQANGTTLPVPATITFPVKIGGGSV